ncbi:sigma factor-like helix-turn-helix DNA-binding protein [Sutcliffiella cohnii]
MQKIVVPDYLQKKVIPVYNNIFKEIAPKYQCVNFGDFSEQVLKLIYNEHFEYFWSIIKYLSFQGITFTGKLNRFDYESIKTYEDLLIYLDNETEDLQLDYDRTYAFLKIKLHPLGITKKSELHLVPYLNVFDKNFDYNKANDFLMKEGFRLITKDFLQENTEVRTLIHKEKTFRVLVNNKKNETSIVKEKNIKFVFEEKEYYFDVVINSEALNNTVFKGVNNLIHHLLSNDIRRVSDLPESLDSFQTYRGVGRTNILKFLEILKELEYRCLKSKQNASSIVESNTSIIFVLKDEVITVPLESGNVKISYDNFPNTRKLVYVLNKMGYKYVLDLPQNLDFMLNIKQIGKVVVQKFIQTLGGSELINKQRNVVQVKAVNVIANSIKEKGYFLVMGEKVKTKNDWYDLSIIDKFSKKINELFKRLGIQSFGELPSDLDFFLAEKKFKKLERQECIVKVYNILPIDFLYRDFCNRLKQFESDEKPPFIDERDWIILIRRLNGVTLEEIGKEVGVTRERVRQIFNKQIKLIFTRYEKLYRDIYKVIDSYPFYHLNDYMNLSENEFNKLLMIFEIIEVPFSMDYPFIYTDSKRFLSHYKGFTEQLFDAKAVDHIFTYNNIELYVRSQLSLNDPGIKIDYLVQMIIDKEMKISSDGYSKKVNLTKAQMCEIVFEREFPEGHSIYKNFAPFKKKLVEYYPGVFESDTDRSIIANLTRENGKVVLWRIGYFKHLSSISAKISKQGLEPIVNWLTVQMKTKNIIQLTTNAALEEYREYLSDIGIDNEHALFSMLRIYYPDSFNYSRSPNIVLKGHQRREKHILLESFILEQGDYVEHEQVKSYFLQNLGWTQTMFDQTISFSELILKTKDNSLVHLNNIKMEQFKLSEIVRYIKTKLIELQNIYSLEALYEDKKSTMLQMNIKDARVLYHLLERNYSNEFDYPRYPYIYEKGKFSVEDVATSRQFEAYFLQKADYLTRDELNEEFLQNRGWKQSTYYRAFAVNKGKIVETFPDEYAHIHHIGWNDIKQAELEDVLLNFMLEESSDTPYFNVEDDILRNDDLLKRFPGIEPYFDWTQELLVSLIEMMDSIYLLGTLNKIIAAKGNSFDIGNDFDLIGYILKEEFEGFCKISELEKYLSGIELFSNHMPTSYMVNDVDNVRYNYVNDEFILKELMVGE